jgi:steroid delta-isomerase-like uncharacterized protein
MTGSDNKALVRRYYHEILEQRNTAIIDDIFSPNFLAYPALSPVVTLHDYKAALATSHYALEDIHVSIDDQIAEGEKVVTRWHATAIHQGTFIGIPATGKTITTSAIHIHRIIDGKIVEFWEQIDLFGMFVQIGSFPKMI